MSSKIYTKTGDQGQTSLADGTRVEKESPRIDAYGCLDEANSWVGTARAFCRDPLLCRVLEFVQHRFYNCSSNLATPAGGPFDPVSIAAEDIVFMERAIDRFEERTGGLSGFVLPGGARAAGLLHIARTVCRRAERTIWALSRIEDVDPLVVKFVNRSSDLLFAAARYANSVEGDGDVLWKRDLAIPEL